MVVSLFVTMPMVVSASETWLWPVSGYYNISSGYGQRSSGWHKGIDIDESYVGNITGKPAMASRGGTATVYWGYNGGAGNYVVINHGDGYVSRYLHLDSIAISNGNVVKGQTIGYVGNTGDSSGPHLHFDIKYNGAEVNPMPVNYDNRHTYKWNSAEVTQNIRYDYNVTHTHSFLTITYEAAHPHKEFKACTCGYTEYTGKTHTVNTCSQCTTPGKPSLLNMMQIYGVNTEITLSWEETVNTTHYNVYFHKTNEDGEYEAYQHYHYANSGNSYSLPVGEYRVQVQSTNSNAWTEDGSTWRYTDSDWYYFTVTDQKPVANMSADKGKYIEPGTSVTFNFEVENATYWYFTVNKDGERVFVDLVTGKYEYTYLFEDAGEYQMALQTANDVGWTNVPIDIIVTQEETEYSARMLHPTSRGAIPLGQILSFEVYVERANEFEFLIEKDGVVIEKNTKFENNQKNIYKYRPEETGIYDVSIRVKGIGSCPGVQFSGILVKAGNGVCGENLSWYMDKDYDIMVINGTGNMYDYDKSISGTAAWSGFDIENIVINSGVTSIGDYAFYGINMGNIEMASTVTQIGEGAFYGSTLPRIWLPKNLTLIEKDAFYGCGALADVYYEGSQADWNKITIESGNENLINAKIHFEGESTDTYLPGDINDDGEVTTKDATTLRRYIAGGYDVTVVNEALDVNVDGTITTKDVTTLRRFIAGGYGVELK